MGEISWLQYLPPALVLVAIISATYYFYTKYVLTSRNLITNLEKIGATVRSMTDGEESTRKHGVGRVFANTPLENLWKDFAKTLHNQVVIVNGAQRIKRSRMTVPPSHVFSVQAVVDRALGVDYFKHLPGILTGIGIIGTFSGLLFGLSSFDSSSPETMQKSVSLLLHGVRDAFYASAAAIGAAMVITHWEKLVYKRCLNALDQLVESIASSFEAGVNEEYLATLVQNTSGSFEQSRSLADDFSAAMIPIIKQQELLQNQQAKIIGEVFESIVNEANRRLAVQIDNSLYKQVRSGLDDLIKTFDGRVIAGGRLTPEDAALKVIRAHQQKTAGVNTSNDAAEAP